MADAVSQMPCRAVRPEIEFPLQLKRRYALLRGAEQSKCHQPFAERNMAVFEDRPDCDGELFMTVVALEAALPMPGPFLAADTVKPRHVLHGAAMWADWTIRPQDAFDGFASLIFGKGGD